LCQFQHGAPSRHRARRLAAAALALVGATLSLAGCSDSITEPIVPDAVVLPEADTVIWGERVTLTASYRVGGAVLPSDGGLRWRTTRPQFFSLDSLTGEGEAFETLGEPGVLPVLVIAESHGVADTMTVFVVPSIHRLVMTVSSAVAAGRTFRPVIQALDGIAHRDFTPAPEMGTPVLRSSNPAVVSVGADLRLTALAAGEAWVVATLQGASDSTLVRVGPGYPISLIPQSGDELSPVDVNDAGQAIATWSRGSSRVQYLFDGGTREFINCDPRAINNAGTVVCGDGRVYASGALGPYPEGQVLPSADISESGAVLGNRRLSAEGGVVTNEAVLWDGSTMTPLPGSRCCGPFTAVHAVNARGHAVGSANAPGERPLIIRGTTGQLLDALGPSWENWASPHAINDADDVVGSGPKVRAAGTALVWLAAEQWKGRYLGLRTQWASGISESGLVVGGSLDGAFVWRADRYALLQDLVAEDGWTISHAGAISRGGVILATGTHTSGKRGLVLITATRAP
jgi:hypothetical protein